ncbi:MAG: MoaD/ThiS family protein [Phycisphaerales bacterium]
MSEITIAVQVLLFAQLAELAQRNHLEIAVPVRDDQKVTVQHVLDLVQQSFPAVALHVASAAVAVNEHYADRAAQVREGDVIALIPPVSGG